MSCCLVAVSNSVSWATFSKLLKKILGKTSYLSDDLGKTAILKTS